jgi:hexosaminidase
MMKIYLFLFWGVTLVITAQAQQIIPEPQEILSGQGFFNLTDRAVIVAPARYRNEALILQNELALATGLHLKISNNHTAVSDAIVMETAKKSLPAEAYNLSVGNSGIVISASDSKGIFYGTMSLLQLLPPDKLKTVVSGQPVSIPAVSINDFPRFKWRGLMLDVSRTFMPPDYIKRTIRRMSFYKLNVLHLHLTDDQGWRIPVRGYPLLVEKASHFDTSYHEPAEFQGYYSRADIAELVQFAALHHVDVVPEIESPGHSHAALYAYPDLSCDGRIAPIFPFFSGPGVTNDVFCVGNPGSLKFFQTVITETAGLFPSPYLHLGGDEVPRTEWEHCPKCQALVQSAHLENTSELQGYFMQELHDQVVKERKRPVAWDEILVDNKLLSKDWVIMSWRGVKPGIDAAMRGYDVVMTPTSNLYFDYPYTSTNTRKVFDYDPFDGKNNDTLTSHILGIQANFWSHIDRTESRIDNQLYPRLLALAERAWSSSDDQNFIKFRERLIYQKNWLDYFKIRYYNRDF